MRKQRFLSLAIGLVAVAVLSFGIYANLPGQKANRNLKSAQAAGTPGKLYLSPASATIANGGNVTYTIKVDTGGQTVNAVQANLSYPASLFGAVTIDTISSAFSVQAENTASAGSIRIARATTAPVTGVVDLAKITFTASSAGSAVITWATGSAVVESVGNTDILGTSTGSTTTISSPTSPPPPTPPPTTPPPATPPPTSGTTTTTTKTTQTTVTTAKAGSADTTPPVISGLQVVDITDSSAVVKWTTSEPTTGQVEYGIGDSFNFNASAPLSTDHSVALQKPFIDKGISYSLRIVATDAAGNGVRSSAISFDTPGFDVTVKVVDELGKPIADAVVTVDGQTVKTDKDGNAILKNLKADTKQFSVTSGGKTVTTSYQVGKHGTDGNYLPQQLEVKATRGQSLMFWIWIGLGLIGSLLLLSLMMSPSFRRRIKEMFVKQQMSNMQAAPVTTAPAVNDSLASVLGAPEGSSSVKPGTVVHPESTTSPEGQ